MLYYNLIEKSKKITIYTFNIAQVNLIKKKLEKEKDLKVILLNEDCSNFIYSDYIFISFIESEISDESKKKYPFFKSEDYKKYYNFELLNKILTKYTKKVLYVILNYEYFTKIKIDIQPIGKISNEIQVPVINRNYVTNEYNICFIIDNTGSMSDLIYSIKEICHNFFVKITKKYSKYKFYFGCVLYADKPSIETDENFIIDFTQNEKEFKSQLNNINLQHGYDAAEDWVSGFKLALEDLNWGNGTKLIFHIADAPAHGKHFNIKKIYDLFLEDENDVHGKNLLNLIKQCSERNIKITGISIDNIGSFDVFQKEYEKVKGPKYEIIKMNGNELNKGKDYINKKMFDIIENSINQNKAENFI